MHASFYSTHEWSQYRAELEADLASARDILETMDMPPDQVGKVRGRIAYIKKLLDRAERALAPTSEAPPEQSAGDY
jgi:hypothetical protein